MESILDPLTVFPLKGQDQNACVRRKHGPRGNGTTLKGWDLWLSGRVDIESIE